MPPILANITTDSLMSRLAFTADLCRQAKDFATLAEVAREQGNAVQYLAGLLAQTTNGHQPS